MEALLTQSLETLAAGFPLQYQSAEPVQKFLNELTVMIFNLEKGIRQYIKEREMREAQMETQIRKLKSTEAHIPVLQTMLKKHKNSAYLVAKYEDVLQQETINKHYIERWMEMNHPNKTNKAFMKHTINQLTVDYMKAVGTRLAEWFATGAAGPGTVSFLHQTYTSPQ